MALIKCKECGKDISDTAKVCINCGAKTEKAKKNNKKIIVIAIIIIFLIILITGSIFIIQQLNNKTNLSANEVVEYLQSKGYKFEALKSTLTQYTTYYIYVNNDDIAFQLIDNIFTGTMYSWKNNKINDDWAEINETTENNTTAKKKQYEAYQEWLNELGLNDTQIIEALDYYKRNTTTYKNMDY
jgi:hypothetical protein